MKDRPLTKKEMEGDLEEIVETLTILAEWPPNARKQYLHDCLDLLDKLNDDTSFKASFIALWSELFPVDFLKS